jgi:NAD(P)-dependent dehydrogenase (short-subunit alcohol dehydrogenase family)
MSRVVYVTGAASGNGWSIADRFLRAGDNVIAVDLDGAALEKRRKEDWAKFDKQLACQQGDVTQEEVVDATIAAGREAFGQIDVLVNNAGITGNQEATVVHLTPMQEYDRVMAVNVRSIFLICRAVLPEMMDRGDGIILNIASVAGMVAFPGRAAYVASKGAVIQLTRSITADYGHYGIRALALCPGMIETPMTKWRLDQPELRKAMIDRIPQREIGLPEDVANAVFYFASPEARYFNGAALAMDGGYIAI